MFDFSIPAEKIRKDGNKLKGSASLYLRQHAHNPVYWYPWGLEAHQKAIETNKPIFLSVGYSSCHWCHVMEKEVFEKDDVAEYLNNHFICIKVDREEKPDIDAVYMRAVQAMTGSGGWPMSVFLTPDLKPFFGGTYYPKDAFLNLLNRITTLFRQDPARLIDQANNLYDSISNYNIPVSNHKVTMAQINSVKDFAKQTFDSNWGGFKAQMKFPTPTKWSFLLHLYRKDHDPELGEMITTTLDAIQDGGIHDHLAGGFHRYTVDPTWSVPHFEKMLYDNAQLASLFFEASVVFENQDYQQTGESILDFLIRDMRNDDAFYASYDADSNGVEGEYYVWSKSEIKKLTGNDSAIICDYFGISQHGNFEGKNVLTISSDLETLSLKYNRSEKDIQDTILSWTHKLLKTRKKRVAPTLDKKIVLSWNALTISALVKGYRVTGNNTYLEAAEKTIVFIYKVLHTPDDTFYRTFSEGKVEGEAVLDDYAFLADSLVDLFEVTGNYKYLERANEIIQILQSDFMNSEGGFYFTHSKTHTPMGRQQELFDNVEPSGFSIALKVFHRMGWLTFNRDLLEIVNTNLEIFQELLNRARLDMASTYEIALMQHLKVYSMVTVIDSYEDPLFLNIHKHLPINTVIIPLNVKTDSPGNTMIPGLDDKKQVDNLPTIYLCEIGSCLEPLTGFDEVAKHLI